MLRDWMRDRKPVEAAWPAGKWYPNTAEMLRADLTRCGIPYTDEDGRVFDFHGLRGQFITELCRQKVHPRTAQKLARHSTIDLTMNVYTDLNSAELASAVDSLPSPIRGDAPEAAKATGTDGDSYRKVRSEGGQEARKDGRRRTEAGNDLDTPKASKTLEIERKRTGTDEGEQDLRSGPARIRTENQGIMSPLL
jgi:hypothetical protein